MSDDFIPFNQSTPVHGRWQGRKPNQHQRSFQGNWSQNGYGQRRGQNNRWSNNSQRNSSYGSDSNNSYNQESGNIDAYLHPSMLQDPWEQLRQRMNKT